MRTNSAQRCGRVSILGVFVVAAVVVGGRVALAQSPPARAAHGHGLVAKALDTSGDHPLTTLQAFDGQVEVAVDADAFDSTSAPAGSFTIAGIPSGATIRQAWLIASNYCLSCTGVPTVGGSFAGPALPAQAPSATDPGYPLYEWRWDVTALVTGNGPYAYSLSMSAGSLCYGVALVVVYEHASLPVSRVVVNDGAEDLQAVTSTTMLSGFSSSGAGRLIVFTAADDANENSTGERLVFNGATLLGPDNVFQGNLGNYASLITVPVTVRPGPNTVAVTAGEGDEFALHLAVLVAQQGETAVPLLSPWALVALAAVLVVLGLLAVRRL